MADAYDGMFDLNEAKRRPRGGVTHAADLSWDRRDRGGEYLIVERGGIVPCYGGPDLYTAYGRIVATARTPGAAEKRRELLTIKAYARGLCSALYTVIKRTDVIVEVSDAPYGCQAGEGTL